METKGVGPNLVKYLREMRNDATSHDKVILLLSAAILAGTAITRFKPLIAAKKWPMEESVLAGIVAALVLWLVSFSLGVGMRKRNWRPEFPPLGLIGRCSTS